MSPTLVFVLISITLLMLFAYLATRRTTELPDLDRTITAIRALDLSSRSSNRSANATARTIAAGPIAREIRNFILSAKWRCPVPGVYNPSRRKISR